MADDLHATNKGVACCGKSTDADGEFRYMSVDDDGNLNVVVVSGSGGAAVGTNKSVDVNDTVDQIVAATPTRNGLVITNNTSTDVYLGFEAATVSGAAANAAGGVLLRMGGSFVVGPQDGYLGPVYGITPAGLSTVVGVLEW